MSRTYRLRHLPQPEGGRFARRFVDSSVREPARRAESLFLEHLAHTVLKLPCRLSHPPLRWGHWTGWHQTHERCLPRDVDKLLWSVRMANPYWYLGWTRTVPAYWHPIIGYSLPHVPSSAKRFGRKQAYRTHRRHAKRLLRTLQFGPEIDPDSDRADYDAKSIKTGLARSAWLLTW